MPRYDALPAGLPPRGLCREAAAQYIGIGVVIVGRVVFPAALRHGELSVLYPLIALGYVWVTITAVVAFHETMNPLKLAGLAVIIAGVAVLGWGGGK